MLPELPVLPALPPIIGAWNFRSSSDGFAGPDEYCAELSRSGSDFDSGTSPRESSFFFSSDFFSRSGSRSSSWSTGISPCISSWFEVRETFCFSSSAFFSVSSLPNHCHGFTKRQSMRITTTAAKSANLILEPGPGCLLLLLRELWPLCWALSPVSCCWSWVFWDACSGCSAGAAVPEPCSG